MTYSSNGSGRRLAYVASFERLESRELLATDLLGGLRATKPYSTSQFVENTYLLDDNTAITSTRSGIWKIDQSGSALKISDGELSRDVVRLGNRFLSGSDVFDADTGAFVDLASRTSQSLHSSVQHPVHRSPDGQFFYFVSRTDVEPKLWRTDFTAEGTVQLGSLGSNAEILGVANEHVVFAAREVQELHYRLHSISVATGEINTLRSEGWPHVFQTQGLGSVNGRVLILKELSSGSPGILVTDGTLAGTFEIPGHIDQIQSRLIGNHLFYHDLLDDQLKVTDGTHEGTGLASEVVGISQPNLARSSENGIVYITNGSLFVRQENGQHVELAKLPGFDNGSVPRLQIRAVRERVVVGVSTPDRQQIWVADGTVQGTDSYSSPALDHTLFRLTVVPLGDALMFTAGTEDMGTEPWITDGTPEGTRLVGDLSPGRFPVGVDEVSEVTTAGDDVFFVVNDDLFDNSPIWFALADDDQARPVTDLNAGIPTGVAEIQQANEGVAFAVSHDGVVSVWATDGTPDGTRELMRAFSGNRPFELLHETESGAWLFRSGQQLWVTHADGPKLISDTFRWHFRVGDWIAITRDDQLFRFDGSSLIRLIDGLSHFQSLGSELFWLQQDGDEQSIWRTNGSANGTTRVDVEVSKHSSLQLLGSVFSLGDRVTKERWIFDPKSDESYKLFFGEVPVGSTPEVHELDGLVYSLHCGFDPAASRAKLHTVILRHDEFGQPTGKAITLPACYTVESAGRTLKLTEVAGRDTTPLYLGSNGFEPGLVQAIQSFTAIGDSVVFIGRLFRSDLRYQGDANGDQEIDARDIDFVHAVIRGDTIDVHDTAELNGDGRVDQRDVDEILNVVHTRAGDSDLSFSVDFTDFLALSTNLGKAGGWAEGDFDGSGFVDEQDFEILVQSFGYRDPRLQP